MTAGLLAQSLHAEEAEKEVKAAVDAMNKQLPEEAQGGSMMPLTEEKEGGRKEEEREGKSPQEEQVLDTFGVEIDALDTVTVSALCKLVAACVC